MKSFSYDLFLDCSEKYYYLCGTFFRYQNMTQSDSENRNAKAVTDKENIVYILSKYLKDEKIYLKGYYKKIPAKVEVIEDNRLKVFLPFDYEFESKIYLYGIIRKYIEFELDFVETINIGRHIFDPVKAIIATSNRQHERFPVKNDSVTATHFQVLPEDSVIINSSKQSVAVFAVHKEYERRLSEFYPEVEIKSVHNDDPILEMAFKSKKMIYLRDTYNENSYNSTSDEMVDVGIQLGNKLYQTIKDFREKKIRSILIYPVIYHRYLKTDIAVAYIKIISFNDPIDIEYALPHLNYTSHELLEKIKKTLITDLDIEQRLLDISEGGMKLLATHHELIKYFNTSYEVLFELLFRINNQKYSVKLQGRLINKFQDHDHLKLGILFSGSEDKGFEKLKRYIKIWLDHQK